MRKKLFITLIIALIVPFAVAEAHISSTSNSSDTSFMMMQQVEDQALGDDLHEEMEDLMTKMMSGTLTQTEEDRIIELMNEYPGPGSMMMGRMMGMNTFGSGFNGFNQNSMMGYGFNGFYDGFFMLIFWALVIGGVVALVKYMSNTNKQSSSKSALDILKERYAKGEIDKKEFEEKKRDLE